MRKYLAMMVLACGAWTANAAEITDVISASTINITDAYEQQEVTLTSPTVYLVTLKDDGNGPQFKAGSSGIVSTSSCGVLKRVEVAWGSKSNENIEVYGQHTPYAESNGVIAGTLLGTIEFSAGTSVGLDIDGEWEYIGITTTANKGKAAQVGSISITWETSDETPDEPCQGARINEVCGDDGTSDGSEDWIEIYNPTSGILDLSGVTVQKTDEDGVPAALCTIADGVTLAPGEYYVVEKGTHFAAGISNNKNVTITLISPLGVKVDMFDKVTAFTHNGSHPAGGSYSYDTATGKWYVAAQATKGTANVYTEPADHTAKYVPVTTADALADGLKVLLINPEYGYVMSYNWDTTKNGGVYLYGVETSGTTEGDTQTLDPVATCAAEVTLCDGGDGTWALKFGDTNNYLNDSRYMACTAYKNIDFKKNDDPTKGTRATITFNDGGDAEINYGEGGVIKFNYKEGEDSRFFNYDPTDKPEEHFAVYLYTLSIDSSITSVSASQDAAPVYYNLQGQRVTEPAPGMYIRVQGTKANKIIVR